MKKKRTKTISLSHKDWAEIYYALEVKAIAIEQGKYGPSIDDDVDVKKWVADLRRVAGKIASRITV